MAISESPYLRNNPIYGDEVAADVEPHEAQPQPPTTSLPLIAAPFGLGASDAKADDDQASDPAVELHEDSFMHADVSSVEPKPGSAGRAAGIGPRTPTYPKAEPKFELPLVWPLAFSSSPKAGEGFVRPKARTPSKMRSAVQQHMPRQPAGADCQCDYPGVYPGDSAPVRSPGPWPSPSPPPEGPPAAPRSPVSAEAARVLTKIISIRSGMAAAANAEACLAANRQAAADFPEASQPPHAVGSPPCGTRTCARHKEAKRTLETLDAVGPRAAKRPKGWPNPAPNLTNPAPKPAKVAPFKARGGSRLFCWPEAAAVKAASAMLTAIAVA